jgi:hypothetical protein
VLVEGDQLFFHVLSRQPEAKAKVVEDTFRRAFVAVWNALPERDQERLLIYWRNGTDLPASGSPCPVAHARPLIRVIDGRWSPSSPTCDGLGHHLTFPTSLVTEHEDLLPAVIARTLAVALRYSTRAHWALYLKVIDGPMDRWEARHGKRATDAAREAALDRLEQAYLREYEAEVTRIVRGWGFAPPEARAGASG